MPLVSNSQAWKDLADYKGEVAIQKMRDMFVEDPERFGKFSVHLTGKNQFDMTLDYSKNRIDETVMEKLVALAKERNVEGHRDNLFKGGKVNTTAAKAALFPSLRHPSPDAKIAAVKAQMKEFALKVRKGEFLGSTGKPISDIVNIGTGACNLGPEMVANSLKNLAGKTKLHFVSNIDGAHLVRVLERVDAESTLFIITNINMNTQETLLNFAAAKAWMEKAIGESFDVAKHFVAVTTDVAAAQEKMGVPAENCFEFWDWVPARFSVWSAVGLSVAIYIGWPNFEQFLNGAHCMDNHFKEAPMEKNMPIILALLGVWYRNFFNYGSHAILPYDQALSKFANYFQQLDMVSNGKHVTTTGEAVDFETAPITWGGSGTTGQHLYHQLLHHGTQPIPADFICFAKSLSDDQVIPKRHHDVLLANCLAQSEALMRGQTADEVSAANPDLKGDVVAHKVSAGNRPSNTMIVRKLTPYALGNLMALYEHKVVVQGCIWGINSFDRFGTDFGKQLAEAIEPELDEKFTDVKRDASTVGLIKYIKELQVFNPF